MGESTPVRRMLKGALHTHTTCSDGDLSPAEVLRAYRNLDFDFVALTDHDFLMTPGAYEREEVPDEFEGMLVFKGVEASVFARGYVHVIRIRGASEELNVLSHPAEYDLTVAQVVERLREIEQSMPIHAVEVTFKGFYTPEYDVNDIPYPKVACDDSHSREGCGRAWIEVSCEKDRDAILRAIKSGRARMCHTWTSHRSQWAEQGDPQHG